MGSRHNCMPTHQVGVEIIHIAGRPIHLDFQVTCLILLLVPTVTTTYQVTVDDGYSVASGSVTVTVYNNPVPDAGSDQAIPYGTSTVLQGSASSGSGNYSYSWEPADKLINPNVAQPTTVNLNSNDAIYFIRDRC